MNGLIENILSELFVKVLLTILAAAITIIGYIFHKYVKRQKKRDEEQDQLNAELERKLKSLTIRVNYYEKQRLIAYKKIRQFAQEARDQARLIQNHHLISDYDSWTKSLFENYEKILSLLHEHALLLEHYRHYKILHVFKNSLLNFCRSAGKLNPERDDERSILLKELEKFLKRYKALVARIKFPSDSIDVAMEKTSN
jgi:Na+-transporting methylmalonyl-CoA/oxaloacetate decarboxylase gamma subunit